MLAGSLSASLARSGDAGGNGTATGVALAVCGLAAGLLVGSGIAFLLVHILRALFVLDPAVTFPAGHIAMLSILVLMATLVSGLAATEILRRLKPTEILREE